MDVQGSMTEKSLSETEIPVYFSFTGLLPFEKNWALEQKVESFRCWLSQKRSNEGRANFSQLPDPLSHPIASNKALKELSPGFSLNVAPSSFIISHFSSILIANFNRPISLGISSSLAKYNIHTPPLLGHQGASREASHCVLDGRYQPSWHTVLWIQFFVRGLWRERRWRHW